MSAAERIGLLSTFENGRADCSRRCAPCAGTWLAGLDITIDTEASEYPITREWAVRLYEDQIDAEGLLWTSRQDDRAQAVVLLETRLRGLSFIPAAVRNRSRCRMAAHALKSWIWQTAWMECWYEGSFYLASIQKERKGLAVKLCKLQKLHPTHPPVTNLTEDVCRRRRHKAFKTKLEGWKFLGA